MSIYGDAPDLRYIRSGGREGYPMGCGGTYPTCQARSEEYKRQHPPLRRASRREDDGEPRDEKDPRYSWLPPV